jgi:hypothetical protein
VVTRVGLGVVVARWLLVAGCVLVLVTVGVTASAVWGGTGRGLGAAGTGTAVPVTLSPGTPAADLHPGSRADVLLTVTNPNPFSVRLGALVLDLEQGLGGFAVDTDHAACGVSELSYTRQTNGGIGWTVPAKAGSINGTRLVRLPVALTMSTAAVNACQGARISVYLAVESR